MEARQGVFTRFYLNMIRAGEAGGALDVVLQRLTEFIERSKELRDTVKSALIYPAILVGVSLLSVAILLMWVVPQFSQMFEESGKALPLPTQIVIAAGDGVRNYWWLMVLLAVGAYSWFARQMREPASRFRWDQRLLNLPLVGDLIGKLEVARFSRTLGTLIGNGVTLLAALSIVKETLSNTVMCQALGDVAAQLKEGKGLGKPLMETKLFPKLAVHLVMVGEETGNAEPEDDTDGRRREDDGADIDGQIEDFTDVGGDEAAEDDDGGGEERQFDGGVHDPRVGPHGPPAGKPPRTGHVPANFLAVRRTRPPDPPDLDGGESEETGTDSEQRARAIEEAEDDRGEHRQPDELGRSAHALGDGVRPRQFVPGDDRREDGAFGAGGELGGRGEQDRDHVVRGDASLVPEEVEADARADEVAQGDEEALGEHVGGGPGHDPGHRGGDDEGEHEE